MDNTDNVNNKMDNKEEFQWTAKDDGINRDEEDRLIAGSIIDIVGKI